MSAESIATVAAIVLVSVQAMVFVVFVWALVQAWR